MVKLTAEQLYLLRLINLSTGFRLRPEHMDDALVLVGHDMIELETVRRRSAFARREVTDNKAAITLVGAVHLADEDLNY